MTIRFTPAQAKFLAGLFTNLAAGWLGALFITPNFLGFHVEFLTYDVLGVTMCSWIAIKLEEKLEKYDA